MSRSTKNKNRFKRVLLKLSGESLIGRKNGEPISPDAASSLALRIREAMEMDVEVAVVIGGGNIIRGAVEAGRGMNRIMGDYMGMLGTLINALAIKQALDSLNVDSRVLSAIAMEKLAEPATAGKAIGHLEQGRAVIYAGGTGNPFFTTDTAAALRAAEIGASALLKATKVDGIYTEDPVKNPRAKRYARISYAEALGKRLKVMDATAFSLCMDNEIPIIVFDFFKEGNIRRVLEGQSVGTIVS